MILLGFLYLSKISNDRIYLISIRFIFISAEDKIKIIGLLFFG